MRTERGGRKGRRAHTEPLIRFPGTAAGARYSGVYQCHAFWFRYGAQIDPLPQCSVLKASSALLSFRRKCGLLRLVKRLSVTRFTRLLTSCCFFRYSTAGKSRPAGELFLCLVPPHLVPS